LHNLCYLWHNTSAHKSCGTTHNPHNGKGQAKMDEKQKIKELKEQEGYYTPEGNAPAEMGGCVAMWLGFLSGVSFLMLCGWLYLAYFAPPAPPTPAPTPYPTVVPMVTPAINPAAGQLQTVTFKTAQNGIGYSYLNLNGEWESREVCYSTNVCSWYAPPVPTGNELIVTWWRRDGMFNTYGKLPFRADQLLIQIEE
jgi:hypothetical protein